ncbi:MAG: hypothetical protein SVY15_02690 [Halobacteriota archaeon]|nr:hypothetical protein [Halobacteriota archaeon]
MDCKRDNFSGDDGKIDFLEYDLEDLFEIMGSLSETLYLLFTHIRDYKKGVEVDSSREDYISHGRKLFEGHSSEIKSDICRIYSGDNEKFTGDERSAYEAIMEVISRTDIPEHIGGITGAIIIKMGLDDFCK